MEQISPLKERTKQLKEDLDANTKDLERFKSLRRRSTRLELQNIKLEEELSLIYAPFVSFIFFGAHIFFTEKMSDKNSENTDTREQLIKTVSEMKQRLVKFTKIEEENQRLKEESFAVRLILSPFYISTDSFCPQSCSREVFL